LNDFCFTSLIDLASEKLGGKVLYATDDFFAEKENLIKRGRGIFIPDKYTDHGKWMDGWESRRKRTPGHDYAILKLAVPGKISGFDIDTNHFLGNHPPFASVEACNYSGDLTNFDAVSWTEILEKKPLEPGSQNQFKSINSDVWTHLRLNIFPDGGVARFRVYGQAYPNWESLGELNSVNVAAALNGAQVLLCSDMFFGIKDNLIMPGRSVNMGDGWETRRKREPGNDWLILQLAKAVKINRIEIDTDHFKGNYPDSFSIDACHSDQKNEKFNVEATDWRELISKTKLEANDRKSFESDIKISTAVSHLRLNIYPDGGIARIRVFGESL